MEITLSDETLKDMQEAISGYCGLALRSVMEHLPNVVNGLAVKLGVTAGALRYTQLDGGTLLDIDFFHNKVVQAGTDQKAIHELDQKYADYYMPKLPHPRPKIGEMGAFDMSDICPAPYDRFDELSAKDWKSLSSAEKGELRQSLKDYEESGQFEADLKKMADTGKPARLCYYANARLDDERVVEGKTYRVNRIENDGTIWFGTNGKAEVCCPPLPPKDETGPYAEKKIGFLHFTGKAKDVMGQSAVVNT